MTSITQLKTTSINGARKNTHLPVFIRFRIEHQNITIMKAKFISVLCAALFLAFPGCNKDDDANPPADFEYFLFGHFYGFCHGEQCIEIFKIENGKLYEDTNDIYPRYDEAYEGEYILLDAAKYELVKNLPDKMPEALFAETQTVIGQPDAGDWGGFYAEIQRDGELQWWLIDTMKDNLPEYLHDFTDELQAAVTLLQ